MEFGIVKQDVWRGLSSVARSSANIKERAYIVMELLKAVFEKQNMLGKGSFQILEPTDEKSIAKIVTLVGCARARLTWKSNKDGIVGYLIFERETADSLDRTLWEPIWAIIVPEYDSPFVETADERLDLHIDAVTAETRDKAIFVAGMTILYGIVNGPVTI